MDPKVNRARIDSAMCNAGHPNWSPQVLILGTPKQGKYEEKKKRRGGRAAEGWFVFIGRAQVVCPQIDGTA